MKIAIASPASGDSLKGNRVTADRWRGILESLGHTVTLDPHPDADLLVALHAERSHDAIASFRQRHPHRPLIVALTGTDVYRDLDSSPRARRNLELATRLISLQPLAELRLPPELRSRVRCIYQSSTPPDPRPSPDPSCFEVCVLAHLREVKDPLLAAAAAELVPPDSRLVITHAGAALDETLAAEARRRAQTNPRYRWLGGVPPARGPDHPGPLARPGAQLPVGGRSQRGHRGHRVRGCRCSPPRSPGSVGLLGAEYGGYFPVGDAAALAQAADSTRARPGRAGQTRRVVPAARRPGRSREGTVYVARAPRGVVVVTIRVGPWRADRTGPSGGGTWAWRASPRCTCSPTGSCSARWDRG